MGLVFLYAEISESLLLFLSSPSVRTQQEGSEEEGSCQELNLLAPSLKTSSL